MKIRRRQAGFTLAELMVSSAIGLFTLAVAVQMAADHTVVLGQTSDKVDMYQSARTAVDLLAEDLRHAGLGIGYQPDGRFGGLMRGSFVVAGGARFFGGGTTQALSTGSINTDDLGIRMATGDLRTIASFSGTQGQICGGSSMKVGDTVVMLTRAALHAQTIELTALNSAACFNGQCLTGCQTFTLKIDNSYSSDATASTMNYVGGTMVGDYSEIVWFVVPGADSGGELRRAAVTQAEPCTARDETCGGLVAEDVETLQVAVWQWDESLGQWVDQTVAATIGDRRRLRVDVEVVVRGGAHEQDGADRPIVLELDANRCVGGACGSKGDSHRRIAMRTSVEIRNGGRMQIQ